MKPGLSDRLARLKKARGESSSLPKPGLNSRSASQSGPRDSATAAAAAVEIPLKGEWSSPAPDLWVKTRLCPSPLKGFEPGGLLLKNYPPPEEWLFYDTETTGLSGGAGNIAFLVGIGRPEGEMFRITQYFLRDYPGEPALLDLLKKEIQGSSLFISYNGKSFDKPLLESRFLMNRMPCRMGAQLDLLYPVRSLFRNRMTDCRLGTAEERLLGIEREDDIPGAEIPDIWFEFIKEGEHPDMDRVMEHNDQDILSLAVLLGRLEDILAAPDTLLPGLRDSAALGRFFLDREDPRAEAWLLRAVEEGSPRGEVLLSLYLKRREEWERAASLWEGILERRLSIFAALELAKYREHRRKDYHGALELTERLLAELPYFSDPSRGLKRREELLHRRKRLLRKLEASGDRSVADSSRES